MNLIVFRYYYNVQKVLERAGILDNRKNTEIMSNGNGGPKLFNRRTANSKQKLWHIYNLKIYVYIYIFHNFVPLIKPYNVLV